MTAEEERLKKRFIDLARRADASGRCLFTGFLGLMETDLFLAAAKEFPHVARTLYGGAEGCERQMARLGDGDEPFPIRCVRIEPSAPKFADRLSHRDFLGALMNLGIERDTLGDILIRDNVGYLFCTERIAPFIAGELTQVRHTPVRCAEVREAPPETRTAPAELRVQVASCRADALAAAVWHLSRGGSQELFAAGRVFVDGRLCANPGYGVKPGETVTARGFGKFRLLGESGTTRKGRLSVTVEKYG